MKKVAALLIIFGSGLAAFGFSGWQALGNPDFRGGGFSAGWPLNSQLEIAVGITLLACGVVLRRDSK
ncbi:MAG: hypothetical protein P4N59_15370 [Negativicutes bacterium]|nr:hypothetical protein [Negativicutes bacterium]